MALIEDQHRFILHHEVLWDGSDVRAAVPMVVAAQERFRDLRVCSFDRNFHSRDNRVRLDDLLDRNVLPKKGYMSKADREREACEDFAAARRRHPAIESAINALEHRGLDRVRRRGASGFERTVALSVLAANLDRLGRLLHTLERQTQTTTGRLRVTGASAAHRRFKTAAPPCPNGRHGTEIGAESPHEAPAPPIQGQCAALLRLPTHSDSLQNPLGAGFSGRH